MRDHHLDINVFVKSLNLSIFQNKIEDHELKEVEQVAGDASSRQYFRIKTAKKNYILCLDQSFDGAKNNSHFRKVQRILRVNGISVPDLYKAELRPEMILEEDLGNQTLLSLLAEKNSREEELEIYKSCLDILIKIHQIDPVHYKTESFTHLYFDCNKLMDEVKFTIENFLKGFLGLEIKNQDLSVLLSFFEEICQELSKGPNVLTHRDFHSKNIMFFQKKLFVIDFQDIRMGLPQYDLVSILEDSYYQIRKENVNKLKNYYFEGFIKKNNLQGKNNFEKLYDYMTIQRAFKAIGSFSSVFLKKGDPRFLRYIGYSMEKIREKLSGYPDLEKLKKILFKYYYEN
jgi:aminoglycoside/choline kinase family phosphotransferase